MSSLINKMRDTVVLKRITRSMLVSSFALTLLNRGCGCCCLFYGSRPELSTLPPLFLKKSSATTSSRRGVTTLAQRRRIAFAAPKLVRREYGSVSNAGESSLFRGRRMVSTDAAVPSGGGHDTNNRNLSGSPIRGHHPPPSSKVVEDILCRVRDVNYMPDDVRRSLLEFRVDGVALGKVRPSTAELLCSVAVDENAEGNDTDGQKNIASDRGGSVFEIAPTDDVGTRKHLTLSDWVTRLDVDGRTAAVGSVMKVLRDRGVVSGWRDEYYPIGGSFYEPPSFLMERAAVPLIGAIEYGVHINGLVVANDSVRMWMARRSADKSKFPNFLDHIVAGGQPAGMSLQENCIKECLEEAGIPEDMARAGLIPAGAVSYEVYNPARETVTRAVLFNYDLYLPEDFVPQPVDGEVQEFFLWSVEEILESMSPDYHDPIKPNCYLVIIDWLLRQGHLSPDVPGYLDVLRELRSGNCQ